MNPDLAELARKREAAWLAYQHAGYEPNATDESVRRAFDAYWQAALACGQAELEAKGVTA